MKYFQLIAFALALASSATAQADAGAADATLSSMSRSAEQELTKSTAELSRLRDQIAAEKLPLAQQLTALEEELTQLRRQSEQATRAVDAGTLAISQLKGGMKIRQDELTYLGNLLDEYARTFETKVDVSELQQCGRAIESAKLAAEDTGLSQAQRFERQTAFVELSAKRLFDVIGGMRFPGVGVDLTGMVVEGQFAILGPIALFRGPSDGSTGLVVPQSGSDKPLIRPLEGALQAGIATLIDSGTGMLPFDPSRGGALKELVQKTNIIHIFEKGGPIMWPLLLSSILALGAVIERLIFLARERVKRDPAALEQFLAAVARADIEGAIAVANRTQFFVVRALGYALRHREQSLANALLYSQAQELKRFRRGVSILDTVITLAPLLGLLGTVTGMMGSFSLIGGDLSAPGAITGGIAEALIATAFGLGIAITALLPFNYLNTRTDEARHELESASAQLELLVQQAESDAHGSPRAAVAAAHPPTQGGPTAHTNPRELVRS